MDTTVRIANESAPFGFKWGQDGRPVLNEDESPALANCIALLQRGGRGCAAISGMLNEMGLKHRDEKWTEHHVREIKRLLRSGALKVVERRNGK